MYINVIFSMKLPRKNLWRRILWGRIVRGRIVCGRIVRGRIVWGRIVFGKNCSREELLLGRIALGKNCSWEELSGKNCLGKNSPGRTDNIRILTLIRVKFTLMRAILTRYELNYFITTYT
jgi:hypothetical protein